VRTDHYGAQFFKAVSPDLFLVGYGTAVNPVRPLVRNIQAEADLRATMQKGKRVGMFGDLAATDISPWDDFDFKVQYLRHAAFAHCHIDPGKCRDFDRFAQRRICLGEMQARALASADRDQRVRDWRRIPIGPSRASAPQ
jgi:hypothetical protein